MRKVRSADPGPCGDVAVYPPFRKSASDDFKRLGVAVTFYPGCASGCRLCPAETIAKWPSTSCIGSRGCSISSHLIRIAHRPQKKCDSLCSGIRENSDANPSLRTDFSRSRLTGRCAIRVNSLRLAHGNTLPSGPARGPEALSSSRRAIVRRCAAVARKSFGGANRRLKRPGQTRRDGRRFDRR